MAYSHRDQDLRACGATTIASQDFVFIEGKAWAVQGDPNTDGAGGLISSKTFIKINGVPISVQGDSANQDNLCPILAGPHCAPSATGFSNLVKVE